MDCRGKALAPVVSREMSRHILDSGRMDKIGVRTGVVCDANSEVSEGFCTPYSVWDTTP
jgi:hypothetical protein